MCVSVCVTLFGLTVTDVFRNRASSLSSNTLIMCVHDPDQSELCIAATGRGYAVELYESVNVRSASSLALSSLSSRQLEFVPAFQLCECATRCTVTDDGPCLRFFDNRNSRRDERDARRHPQRLLTSSCFVTSV